MLRPLLLTLISLSAFADELSHSFFVDDRILQNILIPIAGSWSDQSGHVFTAVINERGWGLNGEIPAYRLKISLSNIPSKLKFKSIEMQDHSKVLNHPEDSEEIEIEVQSTQVDANVHFTNTGKPGAPDTVYKLQLTLLLEAPLYILNHTCHESDIKFIPGIKTKPSVKIFYIGGICNDDPTIKKIYFFKSEDAKWSQENTADTFANSKDINLDDYDQPTSIATLNPLDRQGKSLDLVLNYLAPVRPKKQNLFLGIGSSYFNFIEESTDLKLIQDTVSLRADYYYRLLPGSFSLELSGFVSTFSYYYVPKTVLNNIKVVPHNYFYFLTRLAYRVPIGSETFHFDVSAGMYVWGILNAKNLQGPQIQIKMANYPKDNRGSWIYLRGSLLASNFSNYKTDNNEVAGGFGFYLFKKWDHPLSATFDVSRTLLIENSSTLTIYSFSIGLLQQIF